VPHFLEEDWLSKSENLRQITESISATPTKLELQRVTIGLEVIRLGQSQQTLLN
jgi:hypothetical protein